MKGIEGFIMQIFTVYVGLNLFEKKVWWRFFSNVLFVDPLLESVVINIISKEYDKVIYYAF